MKNATPENAELFRLVVVVPVFNHGASVGGVLAALASMGRPVIVVNDGSGDSTAEVLRAWAADGLAREVFSHETNVGKAEALRTGFAKAIERGFTHVLTIDADGQHDVADVPALVAAATASPTALVVGTRAGGDESAPMASRIGREISNWLVWCESGVVIDDSQSGMRVYPLAAIGEIDGGASRYGFETQVISRAGWFGVAVVRVPIRSIYVVAGGRTTHFRLVYDTALAVRMHAALLGRALFFVRADRALEHASDRSAGRADGSVGARTGSIPRRLMRWLSPMRLIVMARDEETGRERLAISVGVGLAMATLPVYGIKTVACLWLSARFNLQPLVVLAVSSLCTPPLSYLFIFASIFAGHVLLTGSWPVGLAEQISVTPWLELLRAVALKWIVGSVFVAAVLGVAGYLLALACLARIPVRAGRQG